MLLEKLVLLSVLIVWFCETVTRVDSKGGRPFVAQELSNDEMVLTAARTSTVTSAQRARLHPRQQPLPLLSLHMAALILVHIALTIDILGVAGEIVRVSTIDPADTSPGTDFVLSFYSHGQVRTCQHYDQVYT